MRYIQHTVQALTSQGQTYIYSRLDLGDRMAHTIICGEVLHVRLLDLLHIHHTMHLFQCSVADDCPVLHLLPQLVTESKKCRLFPPQYIDLSFHFLLRRPLAWYIGSDSVS